VIMIDVSRVPDSGLRVEKDIGLDDLVDLAEDTSLACPVHVVGVVRQIEDRFTLTGSVSGTFELVCGRCLEKFQQDFGTDVSIVLHRGETNEPEEAGPDVGWLTFEGDTFDLVEAVREDILLGIPLRPLCSEDCKGLCTQCGANLNSGDCGCRVEIVDPRLAVLEELKTRITNPNSK